jgi:hypothetical protein
MSGYLDRLGEQLVDAAAAPRPKPGRRTARRRTLPVGAAAVLAAVLVASAVALAVTGTFQTGSPVRPAERPVASAGAGVATRGTRLLPVRAADPGGGMPWGMRLVHTTRGLVCIQVGRISGSQLGVLGQDEAFNDDGRFHPVAPDVVDYHRITMEISSCLPPGQVTSQEASIPQNGVFGAANSAAIPRFARRWISYGLLGPGAVSVSYRREGREHSVPVDPGSGAYLIVLPASPKIGFETGGGATSSNGFVTPQGALSSITYRVRGRLCSESRSASEAAAAHPTCPALPFATPFGAPTRLHRAIGVRLAANGTAVVTFRAPHAVKSAISGYAVEIPAPCHKGTSEIPVERDVRAGELIHVPVPGLFANACGPSVSVRVVYEPARERIPDGKGDVILGETKVRR